MRRIDVLALITSGLIVVTACRGGGATPPETPSSPSLPAAPRAENSPARSPLLIDGDLHGFTPTDDLVRSASRLGDAAQRAGAAAELETLPAAQRVAILRAGIRLRDATAARLAASLLAWNELDDWEQGLTTRLIADAVVDPAYRDEHGSRPDLGDAFERCSGAELPYVLDLVAAHGAEIENAGNLSILHKSAYAVHLPHLARTSLSADADVRRHALDMIHTVAMHTDQHREDVAAALLGIPVEEARRRFHDDGRDDVRAAGDGVPPLLAAVLSLKEFPFDPKSDFRDWAWRWLADTRPAPRDVPFLMQLDAEHDRDVIAWVLRDVDDPRIDPWLVAATRDPRERDEESDDDAPRGVSSVRLGVLAHRGNAGALARLVERARDGVGAETLAVLLAVAPKEGRAVVESRVFGADADAAFDMLRDVRNAWEDVPAWAGIQWDDAVFEGFDLAALARRLDGAHLATIGVSVPHCRTRAIAAAAIAAFPRDRLPAAEGGTTLALDDDIAAFLETAAPDAFRSVLREWARSTDEPTRRESLLALALLGDPQSGPLLVEAVRWGELEAGSTSIWNMLARSPCPDVLAFLRESARDDFAAAVGYGVATGLPERVDLAYFRKDAEPPLPPAVLDEIRALLLDGRWKDAVAHALAAAPDHGATDQGMDAVGLVDDDRVRAYLRRLQERRELGLYPWATAELALMGDPAARTEYERALRTGRYRWGDESDQIAFHGDPRALPFWIDLMEANCCRLSSIRCYVFDHWFLFDFQTEGGHGLSTPVAEARRFVARAGGRFVWSRVKYGYVGGAFVPAPR